MASTSWGSGKGLDGREAALCAVQQALDGLGSARPALAACFVAQEFTLEAVLPVLTAQLGNVPLWGMTSLCTLNGGGEQQRSVVVGLVSGADCRAEVHWLSGYSQDSAATGRALSQMLQSLRFDPQGLLLAADGINGDGAQLCAGVTALTAPTAGGLASGEFRLGRTHQFAGSQWGTGALAALSLGGRLRLGIGAGHGWRALGPAVQVTRARGVWVQELNGQPAAEAYGQLFQISSREWAFPPLTELARLYPLGLVGAAGEVTPCAPLHVEVDGSLRMNTTVTEGHEARLMVADPVACLQAVREAAGQAVEQLRGARPLLAVLLVDAAWGALFKAQPGAVTGAAAEVLGDLPLVGAYTLGQILPGDGGQLRYCHQQVVVALIGEAV